MKPILTFSALVALALSVAANAQSTAVIDLNAQQRSFSTADYDQMLACTLSRHPEETKRYAQYHLQRRDIQTPAENGDDPDSGLLFPAIEGCFEFTSGGPIPFSLDRLIADWGAAHKVVVEEKIVSGDVVTDMGSLAACVVKHNPAVGRAYLKYPFDGSDHSVRIRRALMQSMIMPPCVGTGSLTVDHGELRTLIGQAFAAKMTADEGLQ